MNINAIKRNTKGLWDAGREVGLEIKHRKLSIYSCLIVRLKDKITQRLQISP
jgi:hypothetical protein